MYKRKNKKKTKKLNRQRTNTNTTPPTRIVNNSKVNKKRLSFKNLIKKTSSHNSTTSSILQYATNSNVDNNNKNNNPRKSSMMSSRLSFKLNNMFKFKSKNNKNIKLLKQSAAFNTNDINKNKITTDTTLSTSIDSDIIKRKISYDDFELQKSIFIGNIANYFENFIIDEFNVDKYEEKINNRWVKKIKINNENMIATTFCSKIVPSITLTDYIDRLVNLLNEYFEEEDEYEYMNSIGVTILILSTIYIENMIKKYKFVLTKRNIHRVFLTSILVASKFLEDLHPLNSEYAKICGITVVELNKLEKRLLILIEYSLFTSANKIEEKKNYFYNLDNNNENN